MNDGSDIFYDVTLARVRPRTVPAALARLEAWLKPVQQRGEFVGCLFSELGTVNRILVLRRIGDIAALLDERSKTALDTDPLGIGEFALDITANIAAALPGAPHTPAKGLNFEVRTDVLRPGSLGRAADCWRAASSHASATFAAHTVAGDRPSLIHIWSWQSLDQRVLKTDDAAPTNIWRHAGPDDAPLSQDVEIFRAAPFSPM